MKLVALSIFIICVHGRNSKNVDFNELPEEKLSNAVCQSFHKQKEKRLFSCEANFCDWTKISFNLTDFEVQNEIRITTPGLTCKENDVINFVLETNNDFGYFVQILNDEVTTYSNVTTCKYYTANNLTEDTVYHIRLWAVSYSKKQILHSDLMQIRTPKKYFIPSPVPHIFHYNLTLKDNVYDAIIEWNPNKEYSCHYDVVWFGEESLNEEKIDVSSSSHQAILRDLVFGANYTVNIFASSADSTNESSKETFYLSIPSCLETYQSLDKCRPEAPQNVVINESVVDASGEQILYNIELTWTKPNLQPDYYAVQLININSQNENVNEKSFNVTGNQTKAVFERIELSIMYYISLKACSVKGCSKQVVTNRYHATPNTVTIPSNQQWSVLALSLTIVGLFAAILVGFVVTVVAINRYRAKQKRKEQRYKYFTELEEKIPESVDNLEIDLIKKDICDQWELDKKNLYFQSVIGEGAFGIVRRAYLEMKDGNKMQVAVKMLKESPTSEEIRQFTHEINIMKSVRQHPYIVSLIGCMTEGRAEGPLLVVEYCSRGDLQTYLRSAWDKFNNLQQEIINDHCGLDSNTNYFANKTYDIHNMNFGDEFIIQPSHLLSIARQVALGMEHLAKTRVVHRDLAARNVLVCENHTVKVSDFGLSRDVYQDNVYCKSGGGKLPIRWMALESLTHQRYTTQSDVWSFGILLWEIATLGSTPYVGVHSSDLLTFLKNGNRLKCPPSCSSDLYAIMQNCWKASPKNRPTFTEICKSLEGLLENVSQYLQLENLEHQPINDVKKQTPSKLNSTPYSYERYIKPVSTVK
ncbi:unnamed protein product [Tenebrio molitor]|nr:unnamed protein product [Tenebrio molitor]